MNPYLKALRAKYEGLKSGIEGLQTEAVRAKRDLTEAEMALVREQSAEMAKLADDIKALTDVEERNAEHDAMAARLVNARRNINRAVGRDEDEGVEGDGDGDGDGTPESRGVNVGGATAQDRDPGHYRSVRQGGRYSFFADIVKAHEGSRAAAKRLAEHSRALDTTNEGVGTVAPKWLTEEFAELARQGRALANVVRNVPLGTDPRPLTLPKQTAGTDAEVTEQAAENDPIEDDDAWDSDVDTATPKPTSGAQNVSRQMIDMSSPAIDELIYGDLISAYNLKVEKKVGAAVTTAATTGGGTALQGVDGVEVTDPAHFARRALRALLAVRSARKLPANILTMTVNRYGDFLDVHDTSGRPLIPESSAGPMNVMGIGSVAVDGRYRGAGIVATEALLDDDQFIALRASDVILFESDMFRFRYEQPSGPETIKLGIWAYTAVLARYAPLAYKAVNVIDESSL